MGDEDNFAPRLGRKRGKESKRAARYASRVLIAAGLTAAPAPRSRKQFDGSRTGRGASIGRLLSSRDRLAGYRARRAIVKTRLVRLAGRGLGAARAHLRYIQRDGVTRQGDPGELYSAKEDRADDGAFLQRCKNDRHQFRFIVSAEDADQYEDLKPFVRRLMAQVETDLGTRLDWVAVDHFNTGHPHTHIALRGVDDLGRNLVISREYISHGFRERAAELVTLDLGPRTTQEIEAHLRYDVDQERLTAIDRRLLLRMGAERIVSPHSNDPFFHALEAGRLNTLARMELAEDLGGGRWHLAEGLEGVLRQLGERGDIIRLMQREMVQARLAREQRIYDPDTGPLIGRVIMRGLADELRDRHYLLIDGIDGRAHYVDIGAGDRTEPIPPGAIVQVTGREAGARTSDHAVAEIAAANGGHYSVELHLRHDSAASPEFAEAHIRRLEAMRRGGADVVRSEDGYWRISSDHLGEAIRFERRQLRDRPVEVEVLARQSLEQLQVADGATWLDRRFVAGDMPAAREAGFGQELRDAFDRRRQWLLEQGFAEVGGEGFRIRREALANLQRRELLRVGADLSEAMAKPFVEAQAGDRVEGVLCRSIDLVSGRFVLIEMSHEFALVPWRSEMANQIGKAVSGIFREGAISWRFGRAGPELS